MDREAAVMPPNVKFNRIIKTNMTGDDVKALKIITSRAGFWPWAEFDNIAHKEFMMGKGRTKAMSGVRGLQKALKVTADGVYGPATHKVSLPHRVPRGIPHAGEYIWDAHSQALYTGSYAPAARAKDLVVNIFKWWDWMIARQRSIHYSQMRPMTQLARHHSPPILPYSEDCSSTFIYAAFLAGAKSPDVAYGFSGYGNTDSLVRNGTSIRESEIPKFCENYYLGVYYGSNIYNTHHVSAIKSPSRVASMGNENAPDWWSSIHQGPGAIASIRAHAVV
jgi:hypothetical protein